MDRGSVVYCSKIKKAMSSRKRARMQSKEKFQSMPCTPSMYDSDRKFFLDWCFSRNLETMYAIQGLVYWLRAKAHLGPFLQLRETNRAVYMVLCIHLSLKWWGYDEMFKCCFINDLREISSSITVLEHQSKEFQLLEVLGFRLS